MQLPCEDAGDDMAMANATRGENRQRLSIFLLQLRQE
jgi:hypothetical protein